MLKKAFETGGVLCIDDFGTNLHPLLVKYLVSLFHNPDVNKANVQLVISTHAMILMSPEVLRRDQIYYVEKDYQNGESELFSLDDFSKREGEDYRKSYLLGRFGAVPYIVDAQISGLITAKSTK